MGGNINKYVATKNSKKRASPIKESSKFFDDICTRIKFQDNMYHRVYIKYGCSCSYLLHLQK